MEYQKIHKEIDYKNIFEIEQPINIQAPSLLKRIQKKGMVLLGKVAIKGAMIMLISYYLNSLNLISFEQQQQLLVNRETSVLLILMTALVVLYQSIKTLVISANQSKTTDGESSIVLPLNEILLLMALLPIMPNSGSLVTNIGSILINLTQLIK